MRKDYIGMKYGRMEVIGDADIGLFSRRRVICMCDCGNKKVVTLNNLGKHTISCGCYNKEKNRKHGFCAGGTHKRIYGIHNGMKNRCNNKKNKWYKDYGGRGITYDPKRETFEGFYKDMGETYREGLSIERIDNDGNYNKDNCMRATKIQQSRNRRNNIYYLGKCVSERALLRDTTYYKAYKKVKMLLLLNSDGQI